MTHYSARHLTAVDAPPSYGELFGGNGEDELAPPAPPSELEVIDETEAARLRCNQDRYQVRASGDQDTNQTPHYEPVEYRPWLREHSDRAPTPTTSADTSEPTMGEVMISIGSQRLAASETTSLQSNRPRSSLYSAEMALFPERKTVTHAEPAPDRRRLQLQRRDGGHHVPLLLHVCRYLRPRQRHAGQKRPPARGHGGSRAVVPTR